MKPEANSMSPAALAYLGDCVIELCVRSFLCEMGITHASELNSAALGFVRAGAQAQAVGVILPLLSDKENAVFKRGRNIGHTNTPKSATVGQYRAATGMETLFGWLYERGEQERISELFDVGYDDVKNKITNEINNRRDKKNGKPENQN